MYAVEVTSALDAKTSYQIIQTLLELENMTRIVVTHSLDALLLKIYDSIIVLKEGQIVEDGGFGELLDKKGYFHALYTVSQ